MLSADDQEFDLDRLRQTIHHGIDKSCYIPARVQRLGTDDNVATAFGGGCSDGIKHFADRLLRSLAFSFYAEELEHQPVMRAIRPKTDSRINDRSTSLTPQQTLNRRCAGFPRAKVHVKGSGQFVQPTAVRNFGTMQKFGIQVDSRRIMRCTSCIDDFG